MEAQAARKLVDKLRKGCKKAQQDKEQAAADLQKQDAAFTVRPRTFLRCLLFAERAATLNPPSCWKAAVVLRGNRG